MKIQLIRHATLLIEITGGRILVDPMLSPMGVMPPIEQSPSPQNNPLVPLPDLDLERILSQVDGLIVTHLHHDHWDQAAISMLKKNIPLFCQPGDVEQLQADGFTNIRAVYKELEWQGIRLIRTAGEHGFGRIGEMMGEVSGFILEAEGDPKLYIAGDTRWCPAVAQALSDHRPNVVVVNAGGARFLMGEPITMDAADVIEVCHACPDSTVIAVHMEAINHCLVTREMLSKAVKEAGLAAQVLIPGDSELYLF